MADAVARTVMLIGDSISAWDGGFKDLSSHTVTNAAVSGDTTAFWAVKTNFDTRVKGLLTQGIEVVHIQLGTNDASQGFSKEQYIRDISTVVQHVQSYGNYDILIAVPTRFPHLSNLSIINILLESYKVLLRDYISNEPNVRIGIDWPSFAVDWVFEGVNWDDFTHPSTAGHVIATPYFDDAVAIPKKTVVPLGQKHTDLAGRTYKFSRISYDGTKTPFKVTHDTISAVAVSPSSGAPTVTLGGRDSDLDRTVTLAAGAARNEVIIVTAQR